MWLDDLLRLHAGGELSDNELYINVLTRIDDHLIPYFLRNIPKPIMKRLIRDAKTVHDSGYRARPSMSCRTRSGNRRRTTWVSQDINCGYRIIYEHFYPARRRTTIAEA